MQISRFEDRHISAILQNGSLAGPPLPLPGLPLINPENQEGQEIDSDEIDEECPHGRGVAKSVRYKQALPKTVADLARDAREDGFLRPDLARHTNKNALQLCGAFWCGAWH